MIVDDDGLFHTVQQGTNGHPVTGQPGDEGDKSSCVAQVLLGVGAWAADLDDYGVRNIAHEVDGVGVVAQHLCIPCIQADCCASPLEKRSGAVDGEVVLGRGRP